MGYDTMFKGKFHLQRPLNAAEMAYLLNFNRTRRVKRNMDKIEVYSLIQSPDNLTKAEVKIWQAVKRDIELRAAVNLPYGPNGEFFWMTR
jgi:hypothetical protein